ncbi:hypothetical protein HAHE_36640 [Haloferula helveola]|uniref:Uncharacterized protein n=1 Tax=Haloferula helveola TaxID=490095 RepID=A0ABN6H7W2_9BACT|nr:hypothetical protein HAHE_36640 [Haloferula helveola]
MEAQPPPDNPQAQYLAQSPFRHLRPELWERSKVAHITLVSIGTLLLLPAAYVFFGMFIFITFVGGMGGSSWGGMDAETIFLMISAVGSAGFGVLAWSALGFLFFKRNDARWQRACWIFSAIFGGFTTPCAIGWLIYIGNQSPSGEEIVWVLLVFLIFLAVALSTLVLGMRYARAAHGALKEPVPAQNAPYYG